MLKTYRYRIKDKHARHLSNLARKVNFVWNFCNDTQKHALRWDRQWPTHYDLNKLSAGSCKLLGLSSGTINAVCEQYAKSRKRSNKPILRFRGKRTLGWIPFKGCYINHRDGGFQYFGKNYSVWLSRPFPKDARICDGGSFSQDARGRWYLNLVIETPESVKAPAEAVGIDLGLKTLSSLSNGESVAIPHTYRKSEAKLAKTRMAKSVLDAGWSDFRFMLNYKAISRCGTYAEVNEAYTTRTCFECGSINGPKGREGLGVREWDCDCGATLSRDTNAAQNILRIGLGTLKGAAFYVAKSKGAGVKACKTVQQKERP